MYARHVALKLRADSVRKFARIIDAEVVPLLRKQEGFLNQITLISTESGDAAVITFWHTKQSEEAFNRMQNPEVLGKLLEVIEGVPIIHLFEVASPITDMDSFAHLYEAHSG